MKLELSTKEEIQILEVSEKVTAHECAVLRAGLNKLFADAPANGKKWFILDLTRATFEASETQSDVKKLPAIAKSYGAMIWIASPVEGLGDAPSLREALDLASSNDERSRIEENLLTSQLERLSQEKKTLELQLSQSGKIEAELRQILGNVSRLKKGSDQLLIRLEIATKSHPKTRGGDLSSGSNNQMRTQLLSIITPLLQQQGITLQPPTFDTTEIKG